MSKTPEQMATDWIIDNRVDMLPSPCHSAFLAGYQAAKDEYQAKMQELEANWKFCCEDKVRLLNELAIAERVKDQLADASKVMNFSNNSNGWISVKERLPEMYEWVLIDGPEVCKRIEPPSSNWKEQYAWETNHDSFYSPNDVTHWMPLPEPPKEEK